MLAEEKLEIFDEIVGEGYESSLCLDRNLTRKLIAQLLVSRRGENVPPIVSLDVETLRGTRRIYLPSGISIDNLLRHLEGVFTDEPDGTVTAFEAVCIQEDAMPGPIEIIVLQL